MDVKKSRTFRYSGEPRHGTLQLLRAGICCGRASVACEINGMCCGYGLGAVVERFAPHELGSASREPSLLRQPPAPALRSRSYNPDLYCPTGTSYTRSLPHPYASFHNNIAAPRTQKNWLERVITAGKPSQIPSVHPRLPFSSLHNPPKPPHPHHPSVALGTGNRLERDSFLRPHRSSFAFSIWHFRFRRPDWSR